MNKITLSYLAIFFLTTFSLFGQEGIIRGTVYDEGAGETLIGATVLIKDTNNGAITDFDGKFEIKVAPGTYDLQVSFVSLKTVTISGVVVVAGKPTIINNIYLKEDFSELDEIIVTAELERNSEVAVNIIKMKAPNLLDGIAAATFQKIGDSDASDAVKRITGVSVEGGKYVYVRGLGDRYTKTTLNGVDIPGLDPDRNTLQMDIFPTSLIDNLMVYKSAVAELPADFTGGVVNIETKDLPDEKILDVSFGITYNPSMHFNKDFIQGNSGATDFLGIDDGSRELPEEARNETIPSPVSGNSSQQVNQFLRKFNPTLGATQQTSFMDYSVSLTTANQFGLSKGNKLGYIFSASYKSSTTFFDDVSYGEYQNFNDPNQRELRYATVQEGIQSERNVLVGLLGGLAYKSENSKLRLTALHLQNGVSTAGQFFIDNDGQAVGQSGYLAFSNNLEYNQRSLTNVLLSGEHHLQENEWEIAWSLSPTLSSIEDPDVRKTSFTYSETDTTFSAGAGGNPSRIWRELEEVNLVGKVDFIRNSTLFLRPGKIKFGASQVYKDRDYEILSYDLQFFGAQPDFGIDPNNVLIEENLFPNGTLYYVSGNNTPNPNAYNSNVYNLAFYGAAEFNPAERLKAILGLRAEKFTQRHTGRDVEFANLGSGNNLVDEKVLDALDLFPSLNLVYSLKEDYNLRFSYSKTIARPSFKELSFAQIIDPLTNRIFNGGLFKYSDWDGNLVETRIDNLDLRWEAFLPKGQILTVSTFYKKFEKPIELVRIQEQQTSTEYQPRNVGDGTVLGVEVEFKKNLSFLIESAENFSIGGNFTFVESRILMTDRELNARRAFQKDGENIDNTRNMAGQAPYIVNFSLGYDNYETGLDAGFFYNVKGSTLFIVGGGLFPDVYAEPFQSLNFNLNKRFGKNENTSFNFNVSNILNDKREEVYRGYKTQDQTFTSFSPGRSVSIGLKYSF
ncbi:MAG: TonB-dependent receptor [Cytophagales bacterium CG12_big_fil_rev_8_21_14_0_65_40_12]|nr:MAG: TonB-dependent receptor [Cytophagales bacterium CG12_big_fil_rev_8_21_14_0_65_40_12]PIW04438.1 MAG: TonB-dependent receptor [Cytophagales bacterium CG17_big_fil_post_rev_8_21_14_2_50_40_13]